MRFVNSRINQRLRLAYFSIKCYSTLTGTNLVAQSLTWLPRVNFKFWLAIGRVLPQSFPQCKSVAKQALPKLWQALASSVSIVVSLPSIVAFLVN